jgi:hypothetical protein
MGTPSINMFLESPDFLRTVITETIRNSATAETLTADLAEGQLNWKPSADRWSIAQCLEHLSVATNSFEKYFEAALARGRTGAPLNPRPRYKPTMMGGWLARSVSPEAPRKLSAPKILRPAASSNIHESLEMFLRQQDTFLEFVRRCEGIDYNRTRLRSPVTPLVRYSLADAFVITVLHGQRHLAQAQHVRELGEFPGA